MEDRETLLRFLEAHYDDRERALLGQRAGLLGLAGRVASSELLLRLTEQEGMAASLLACIEQDYPNILPALTWAGAHIERHLTQTPPEDESAIRAAAERPALTLQNTAPPASPRPPAAPPAEYGVADAPDALTPEPKPYRYIHGYTLPAHWAKRDQEMAELVNEVFNNRYAVIALQAIGGTGKSALTRKLLDELPDFNIALDGALWFSFYVEPDFDRFLAEACRYIIEGFDPQAHPSPYEKSVLLREALQQGRYLLVMDGLEVLQVAERDRKNFGAFQDRALREFLEGFGEGTKSQVFISSRFPLSELEGKSYYHVLALGDLAPESADELLLSYQIEGAFADRLPLYERFGTHALTLQVLGDYLARYRDGQPSAAHSIADFPSDAGQGIRLQAVLDAYWGELDTDARFFLTRLAAFRGGVDERSLIILNRQSDHSSPEFRSLVQRLLASPLVNIERREGQTRLTSHPLVKTFFYERMADPERAQTHRALKDYSQGLPLPDRPRTLADYEPLLQACHHCLQVGLFTEAYQVYRRNNMDNALRWWGHYAQATSLLEPLRAAGQGAEPVWMSERWQKSWVENETALLALLSGDLNTAIERFRHSALMDSQFGDALGESASLQNLAGALIQRGDFDGALRCLDQSRTLENAQGRFEKEDILFGLEGVCQGERGNGQNALALLHHAASISAQRGNLRALCYWTWRTADVLRDNGQAGAAQQRYEEALRLAEQEPFRDYIGHAMRGLCDTLRIAGDFPAARLRGMEALRLARTLGNPFLENETALSLARLAEAEGNSAEAQGLARQALGHATESGYQAQATEAHLLLARAAQQAKDAETFQKHQDAARSLLAQTHHAATKQELEALKNGL